MPLKPVDFEYIRNLVQNQAAIVLEVGKTYLAESRLTALARQEGFRSLSNLMTHLRLAPNHGLKQKVVESMTTNETSFFRDIQPFEVLRDRILPELLRQRAAERRLHIWSCACSTGQEPYTVAMILHEHFGGLAGWRSEILATDLSTEVLAKAREGCFSQLEVNRGLSARFLAKYFDKQGENWQIKDNVRRLVTFRPLNLIDFWPALPTMDVIFLRNVLIYFDVATKKKILGKMRQLLRPDGYLFLGGAESTLNLDDRFERLEISKTSCYRLRGH